MDTKNEVLNILHVGDHDCIQLQPIPYLNDYISIVLFSLSYYFFVSLSFY